MVRTTLSKYAKVASKSAAAEDMSSPGSWIKEISNQNNARSIAMDETYEMLDVQLKTNLYPHQRTVVKAMVDIENVRTFKHFNEIIKVSAAKLTEPVGSGKTIEILALISHQKTPKILSGFAQFNTHDHIMGSNRWMNTDAFCGMVKVRYDIVLPVTIIFVGISVLDQWLDAIQRFTSLKVFCVRGIKDLEMLVSMMKTRRVDDYDVVLVKNGKVSRVPKLPDPLIVEHKNKKTSIHIYNIIANMRNHCWVRVVIDDFDMIKMPKDAGYVPSIFTWYVSSTNKHITRKKDANKIRTTADMLMYSADKCWDVHTNSVLDLFKINNNLSFIKQTNNLSAPKMYAYSFKNPNDTYLGLLGTMQTEESRRIMEMLNGDAVETAAAEAGIESTSVADIFQQILGGEYKTYETASKIVKFIDSSDPDDRLPFKDNPDKKDTYNKGHLMEFREIKYNYPGINALLESTKAEFLEKKRTSGVAIQRVKDNIKHGKCAACRQGFEDDNILILKCCGMIVCDLCCFGGVFKNKSQTGVCSNCRANISVAGTIFINNEFDLNGVIEDDLKEPPKKDFVEENTKISAIGKIIDGAPPDSRDRVEIPINNLMHGTKMDAEAKIRKTIIFASFKETLRNICDYLKSNEVKYWMLGGTHAQITQIVREFTQFESKCVLVINSIEHCAGLNLQTATDMIFAHRITDRNVESQAIGRGQRLGRTSPLNVHFMFYQNEYGGALYQGMRKIEEPQGDGAAASRTPTGAEAV